MRLYQILIFLTLFILVFFPVQIDARINFTIILLAVSLLPIAIGNIYEDVQNKKLTTIFFVLFLLASLLSAIFSIDQSISIVQFFLYCSYFIVFTSIRSIFPTHKSKELFAICYLLFAIVLSFISLYHTLILKYVNRATEGVSFMWIYYGHNHLAALLLFAIPISFYLLKKYWRRKFLNALLLVTSYYLLFTMFFTFAFTSMISFGLSLLISLFAFGVFTFPKKLMVSIGIAVMLGLFLLGTFWLPEKIGFKKYHQLSANARFIYWQNAVDNFIKRPFTGSGLDTFRIINRESPRKTKLGSFYTHNFFVQMLSDTGIFGFLSSIGLIFSVLWQSLKKVQSSSRSNRDKVQSSQKALFLVFWIGLLASILNSLVDFDWQLPTVFLIFWILAGLFYVRSPSR